MGGDGGKRGMGRKNRDLHCSRTYVRHTDKRNLGTITSLQTSEDTVMYSEEGGSRCARKRVHLFSLPGLRDGSKNEKLRVLENGGRNTHIMYCKKCRLFWKYDYTNLRRKYKNYTNENYEVSCFLSWLG